MIVVEYHPGGVTTNAPGLGRSYQADSVAGTLVRWNVAGAQISTRALTAEEVAQFAQETTGQTADTNRATIEQRATAFLAATNTYLAIPTPTNAQVAAQVRRNAQATVGLIKIALSLLADTNGTG